MAPKDGTVEPDFWKDQRRVQMLLMLALAMRVKDRSAIDHSTLADIVGEGTLSQASVRYDIS